MTLPFRGVTFPIGIVEGPAPEWWPFGSHEANELELTLSQWDTFRQLGIRLQHWSHLWSGDWPPPEAP